MNYNSNLSDYNMNASNTAMTITNNKQEQMQFQLFPTSYDSCMNWIQNPILYIPFDDKYNIESISTLNNKYISNDEDIREVEMTTNTNTYNSNLNTQNSINSNVHNNNNNLNTTTR